MSVSCKLAIEHYREIEAEATKDLVGALKFLQDVDGRMYFTEHNGVTQLALAVPLKGNKDYVQHMELMNLKVPMLDDAETNRDEHFREGYLNRAIHRLVAYGFQAEDNFDEWQAEERSVDAYGPDDGVLLTKDEFISVYSKFEAHKCHAC
jgi:hypothetical protein